MESKPWKKTKTVASWSQLSVRHKKIPKDVLYLLKEHRPSLVCGIFRFLVGWSCTAISSAADASAIIRGGVRRTGAYSLKPGLTPDIE